MKVLIVSNFYYPNVVGGAEKVAQNLAVRAEVIERLMCDLAVDLTAVAAH